MASTVRQDAVFGADHGLVHEAIVTGRKVGADREFWGVLAHDENMFRRVVSFVSSEKPGFTPAVLAPSSPLSAAEAAGIMGATSFHGWDEVSKHFGFKYSSGQKKALKAVPFPAEMLRECKDTHILVAGAPLSIMDIHAKATKAFYAKKGPWYTSQPFAQEKVGVRWYLIRKDVVPGSTSKAWEEQQALLPADEVTPGANVMAYAIILHYLATSERLLPSVWASTSSVDSFGFRVGVGFFGADGLGVYRWSDYPFDSVGLASSRKLS